MVNKGNPDKSSKKFKRIFANQPISQADARAAKSAVALPNDENVERARNWVNTNKK